MTDVLLFYEDIKDHQLMIYSVLIQDFIIVLFKNAVKK